MMRTGLAAICVAALLVPPAPALAGRDIGYAASGPVFNLPAGVSVARLDVHISIHSVRLAYVFQSTSRQTVHFNFVMPDMPVDASPDAIGVTEGNEAAGFVADTKPVNYLKLSVGLNDTPIVPAGHGRALLNGKDVTGRLRNAGVPLLYHLDGEAPWQNLAPDVRAMLEANGMLLLNAAQWTYQADFVWDAALEPGETRIKVNYVPVAHYWSDINLDNFSEIATGGSATRTYCIDGPLRRAFLSRAHQYELYTVTHLAVPAGGWRGPVGRYRLEVDKQHPSDLVAFCPLDAKKVSPTRFQWTATNYTPSRETGVLFFWDTGAPDEQASEQE